MKLNKKGFTLVELLAVIAILAILMVIAIPGVITLFNNGKENAFVTEVQSVLKAAKTDFMGKAMTENIPDVYCNVGTEEGENCYGKEIPDLNTSNKYFVRINSEGKVEKLVVWKTGTTYSYWSDTEYSEDLQVSEITKEASAGEGDDKYTLFSFEDIVKHFVVRAVAGKLDVVITWG